MKHFNENELRQLLTLNYYCILYYNSEVWHMISLHTGLKIQFLLASAAGPKLNGQTQELQTSFDQLHLING
jgi:hypothetical protein